MSERAFDFDAIRAAHPIETIIGQAVELKKAGREYKGLCPFHDERTPSFHVIPDKGFYHCFGCGAHGDVIDFVAAFQGVDIADAAIRLVGDTALGEQTPEAKAARAAIKEQREREEAERRAAAIAKARSTWEASQPADPAHAYLARKAVEPHSCRQTASGYLVLPIRDADGEVMSIQTIAPDGGKRFQAGAPVAGGRFYLGINMGRTILCEGFATGASIYDAISDQIAVTFSLDNMGKVARQLHAEGRNIVLAADTGNAAKAMRALGAELNVPVIVPRDDIPGDSPDKSGSDFNDQARAFGVDDVARSFREGLREFSETREIIDSAPPEETGPVDLWGEIKPPPLVRGLLPHIIEDFAFENARVMGADAGGLAIAALVACSGAITDKIQVQPKQREKHWRESGRIWAMVIGPPSARKSPMFNRALGQIKKIDGRLLREANKAMADWQENGRDGPPPPRPRLRIENANEASAQEVAKHSPDGLLLIQDELGGLFARLETAGGGSERAFWLQTYNGGEYAVDRIGRGSFVIENLSVSILGGVQPDKVREIMAKSADDGFIQRFIPIIAKSAEQDRDVEIPPVTERFDDLIEALHNLKPPENFFGIQTLKMSEAAMVLRQQAVDYHHDLVRHLEGFNTRLSSHIGKYDGLVPRLSVIWHCIENAGNPDGLPVEISEETVARVIRFLHEYVQRHAFAFYLGIAGYAANDSIVKAVGGAILAHGLKRVTVRDLRHKVRQMRNATQLEREEIMGTLEALGWLEKDSKRSDAPSWVVPDEVHLKFADRTKAERQRRHEISKIIGAAIAEKRGGKNE